MVVYISKFWRNDIKFEGGGGELLFHNADFTQLTYVKVIKERSWWKVYIKMFIESTTVLCLICYFQCLFFFRYRYRAFQSSIMSLTIRSFAISKSKKVAKDQTTVLLCLRTVLRSAVWTLAILMHLPEQLAYLNDKIV